MGGAAAVAQGTKPSADATTSNSTASARDPPVGISGARVEDADMHATTKEVDNDLMMDTSAIKLATNKVEQQKNKILTTNAAAEILH